jgi:hypothetical protein
MGVAKRKPDFTVVDALELLQSAELTPDEAKTLVRIAENIADKEFERRLDMLKASRDGRAIPRDMLANQLVGPAND